MRDKCEPRRAGPALRVAVLSFVVVHLAAFACFATHHHASPNDNTPCLVCAVAHAPAAQLGYAAVPSPPAAPAAPVLCFDETLASFSLAGSAGIRAPPAS